MRPQAEHPLQEELHNERHARPSLDFDGHSDVWHVAIVGENGIPSFPANADDLEEITSTQEGKHGIARLHGGRLKWEVHAEFLTLEERTRVQVHVQQAVEGFSIFAITYYTIGLIKVCLESLVGLGFDAHLAKLMTLVANPVVFAPSGRP